MEDWLNKLQYIHNEIIVYTIEKHTITLVNNWQV